MLSAFRQVNLSFLFNLLRRRTRPSRRTPFQHESSQNQYTPTRPDSVNILRSARVMAPRIGCGAVSIISKAGRVVMISQICFRGVLSPARGDSTYGVVQPPANPLPVSKLRIANRHQMYNLTLNRIPPHPPRLAHGAPDAALAASSDGV